MDGNKITYHQQVSYCGKPRCRKCREGIGHGPYWYAYQMLNGQTMRTYIGKNLPPEIQAKLESTTPAEIMPPASHSDFDFSEVLLRVFMLGQLRLERRVGQQWQTVTDSMWQQLNVRQLLSFLICHPGRKVSRSQVVEALWPSSDKETASSKLNKALHNLRKILGNPREGHPQGMLLRSEGEWLILADQSKIWVDADAFEALLAGDAPSLQSEDISQREAVLREAAALYGGDFLPEGRQVEWVSTRRQELHYCWIALLLEQADLYIARADSTAAIDILNRLLANDPANEAGVQRLIVVLAQLKRRGEALRAYNRLAEFLQREYKTVPSEETRALYETVRMGGGSDTPIGVIQSREVSQQATAHHISFTDVLEQDHVEVSEIVPLKPTRAVPEPIGRTNQSPLVGRSLELEVLRSMLLEVEPGVRLQLVGQRRTSGIPLDTMRRPQCAVLMGESGIGKTRLAEEISREAQRRGWAVVWSRLYQQESGVPYRLWIEALRKAMNVGTGLVPTFYERSWIDMQRKNLNMGTGLVPVLDTLQPLTALLPELSEILPYAGPTRAPQSTPEQDQLRLWEATRDLLSTISESAPLLIVLDDIQWADESSYGLLGYLARHLLGYPVLLLATCRETELPTRPPHPLRTLIAHMQREHSVTTLNVEPLTSEQIGMLVSGMSHLSEPMVQHIQAHAAGNPFFAEEMARTTPPTLPKNVAAALEHRMSSLSASCQQLLGNAAVLGGSFEFPVISLMEAGGTLADEDTVLNLLEEALQSRVLTEEGTGTRITYHFWHPLLVNHLYERVSATRRARLHLRAAEILQQVYRGHKEEVAATITHHLVRAGAEPEQIANYAAMAGDHAYALSAYSEAERHYGLAVEQLDLATRGADFERELVNTVTISGLLERLAECTMIRGNFEEARRLYERLLELRSQQRVYEAGSDGQYEAQVQALLWGEIGWTWRYTGDNAQARQCCRRGEQVLRNAGVTGGPAWARLRYQQSSLYWQAGHYDEARRAAQEALALFEQQRSATEQAGAKRSTTHSTRIRRTLEGDPVDPGRAHRLLGAIANGVGQRTEALAHLNTALALYEQYDYKREIAHVSCDLGYIHLKKAEYELAQAALRRAHSLAERIGDDPIISVIFSNLGELAASSGDLEEAENWYKKGLALAERFNDREYMSLWNAALATILQEQDKLEEAAACIIRALSIGRAMHNNPCIGVALVAMSNMRIAQATNAVLMPRVRTRLLRHAREDVQRALALSGLEAETRTKGQLALAHVSLLLGELEKARERIGRVIEEAQRYELVLVEVRAKRLLEIMPD